MLDIGHDIDFNIPKGSKVAVAMSGGVDSSTVAALLKNAGYEVEGITLKLYETAKDKGLACKDATVEPDVKSVAQTLGIKYNMVDFSEKFMQNIISTFADDYSAGRTPNPCIRCNREIKFDAMLQEAFNIGADYLVTGHYITWKDDKDLGGSILKGDVDIRDQSYFLACVKKQSLKHIRFPLAHLTKSQVREIARKFNLSVADKPSSNDLCFVADGKYSETVKLLSPSSFKEGNIVNKKGDILGKHKGIVNFTVGQRRGIGIEDSNDILYVIAINAEKSEVVVGTKDELEKQELTLTEFNWLGKESDYKVGNTLKLQAKVRAKQTLADATITFLEDDKAHVVFEGGVFSPAPGQLCAIYQNNRLLGGGFIS